MPHKRIQEDIIRDIQLLKKEKKACILVHNYQYPEIYEVADFVGDSIELSKNATLTDAELIIFCGVLFMAESAKLLSPEKRVYIPDTRAGCFLADMVTSEDVRALRLQYPKAKVVCYVNSSAEVKAESDICCTSANAVKIVNDIDADTVIFVPDANLGECVAEQTEKNVIVWKGQCNVHSSIRPEYILEKKKQHNKALVIAHPECRKAVRDLSDHVCGTGGMIAFAKKSKAKEFFVATESGMCERLKRDIPGKLFYPVGGECVHMKRITLQKTYDCLKNLPKENEVFVDRRVEQKAGRALERMMGY